MTSSRDVDHLLPPGDRRRSGLMTQLRAHSAGGPTIIVIDPMLGAPLSEALKKHGLDDIVTTTALPRIHGALEEERAPYLLTVPDAEWDRLVQLSISVALAELDGLFGPDYRGRSLCAWVSGVDDSAAFATVLARASKIRKPDGTPWLMRIWDPRVIAHLPRTLANDHWVTLSQALGSWAYLNASGALNILQPVPQAVAEPSGPIGIPLASHEWSGVQRIGLINQFLALAPELSVRVSPDTPEQVDHAMQCSMRLGYRRDQDLLVFAAATFTAHPRFYRHPIIRTALADGVHDGHTLEHVLGSVTEDVWQAVSSGVWEEHSIVDQHGVEAHG